MTINFGSVPLNSVLPVHFGAYNSAGASVTLTGLAVTDVEIYKGTTVTQRASDAGIALIDTDGIDIDGITGAHGFSIDTGDNTDAGFYAAGSFYNVWVSAVTIDSQTVNFLAATFRLVRAEDIAGAQNVNVEYYNGQVVDTAVSGIPKVDTTHIAGTAVTAAAGIPEVKVASIANGAVTAAAIATGAIDADAIADGAIDAGAFAADAITAAKLAADVTTELQSGLATAASISALNNLSAAQVNAEVVDALNVDTYAEPGQGAPAATTTLVGKIGYLYKAWRNKTTQTATEYGLYNDDTTTLGQKATVSDDATTFTRGEVGTGA